MKWRILLLLKEVYPMNKWQCYDRMSLNNNTTVRVSQYFQIQETMMPMLRSPTVMPLIGLILILIAPTLPVH